ncbi:uncharacterized protein P174DRAFT_14724 [Aspergillus novofumigatus IBT 16806]|uniref:Uncharacterized protein n=1 Tax=Aspergillus novofumigatus (strain IBT 16806) TaxID=1392255 RepID=A0A2I1CL68_ASPN1|nr:uncharacterized protein P174DRAFT_14724 [Aspergillus novofumigatus IBT 16806]PKX98368.1 hypothetical protein P174DRAFT_14724 [Aspergillus novofumigatus IBT 16806]
MIPFTPRDVCLSIKDPSPPTNTRPPHQPKVHPHNPSLNSSPRPEGNFLPPPPPYPWQAPCACPSRTPSPPTFRNTRCPRLLYATARIPSRNVDI